MTTQSAESSLMPSLVFPMHVPAVPSEVLDAAEELGVSQYLSQVMRFTSEIFGGFSRVYLSVDPEIPGDTHIVFEVHVSDPIEAALDKDEAWGQRLMETIPHAPRVYSLSMDFRS
jgi:hypothetical protein